MWIPCLFWRGRACFSTGQIGAQAGAVFVCGKNFETPWAQRFETVLEKLSKQMAELCGLHLPGTVEGRRNRLPRIDDLGNNPEGSQLSAP